MASGRIFCCSSNDLRLKKCFDRSTVEISTKSICNGLLKVCSLTRVSLTLPIYCKKDFKNVFCNVSISIFFESAVVCATWLAESSASDKKFVKNQSKSTISELICLTTYIIQSLGTLGSPTTLTKKFSLVPLTKCKSLNVINNFSILVKRKGFFAMLPK